jgi:hypothetical protein
MAARSTVSTSGENPGQPRDEFPGWSLWKSRGDTPGLERFWATRFGANRQRPATLSARDSAKWAMTVGDVESLDELRDVIADQPNLTDSG